MSSLASEETGFALLNSRLRFLQIDERFLRMHGLSATSVGKTVRQAMPAMAPVLENALRSVIRTGKPALHLDIASDAPSSGGRRWRASCFPVATDGQKNVALILEGIPQHHREGEIASEDWLQAILENTPNLVFVKDNEGRYLLVSRMFESVLQMKKTEIIGRTDEELFPPEQASRFRAKDRQVLQTGAPLVYEDFVFHHDSLHTHMVHKFPLRSSDGSIYAIGGIVTDISEHKRAAEIVRSQFQLLELASEAIVAVKLDLTIQYWNRGAEQLYGWKKEEAMGKSVRTLLQSKFPILPDEIMVELFRKGYWEGEGTQQKRDGTRFPVSARFSLQRDESGTPRAVLAIYVDITERRRSEEKLRETEEHFRLLLDGVKEYAIFMLDPNGNVETWNGGAQRVKGYRASEMLGRHFSCFYTSEDRQARKPEMSLAMAAARGTFQDEGWRLRKDGTRFWADSVITALRDANGRLRGFATISRDASERKQAEEARRRLSERLLKLQDKERRQLARELHDSTAQQLTALSTYLAVLEKSADRLDRRSRKALAECRTLAEECHREIRTFSYLLHPPILDEIGLPDALRWYCDGFTERSGIAVDLNLSSEVGRLAPEVEGALFRIVQESLANIHRHSGSPRARIRIDRNRDQLILEVQDEGHGFTKDVLAGGKISRARVGVGIAGMQERIRQLQGRLDIESSKKGTTVRTIIPIS